MTLLDLSDVRLLYGDGDSIVDLTAARALSQITLTGTGGDDTLRPVGAEDVEVIPITSGESISASGYLGDTLAAMTAIDSATAHVALLLTASGAGVIVPARVRDPARRGLATDFPVQGVIRTAVQFAKRAEGVTDVFRTVAVTGDGNVALPFPPSVSSIHFVATTAGTVDGTAVPVGIHTLAAGDAPYTVVGARGYITQGLPHSLGVVSTAVAGPPSTPPDVTGERISGANARVSLQIGPVSVLDHDLAQGRTGLRVSFPEDYRSRPEPGGQMVNTPLGYRAGGANWMVDRTAVMDRQLMSAHQKIGVVTVRQGAGAHNATDVQFDAVLKRSLTLTPRGSSYRLQAIKTGPARDPR